MNMIGQIFINHEQFPDYDIDNSDKNGSDCLENEARASRNFGRKMTLSP